MGRTISKFSGARALGKAHNRTCANRGDHAKCDCPWRARYKGQQVALAKWANITIDPRSKKDAIKVLNRLVVAIDNNEFDPTGEREALGTGQRLRDFMTYEFNPQYIEKNQIASDGQRAVWKVIEASQLASRTLEYLAGSPYRIEKWLDAMARLRGWKPRTWNAYHRALQTVFEMACKWKVNNVARMKQNPMASIDRKTGVSTKRLFRDVRLEEPVEDRLFAVVDSLNRPQHRPNRTHLTMEKADKIRQRVADGELQTVVAKAFKIQPSTVNAIVKGETWNPAKYRIGTKGTEMRRRLMCAFDTGARASEMLAIQIKHVLWRRPRKETDKATGVEFNMYEIVLPAKLTKGGKTTGEDESLFVGTLRLSQELDRRRLQLKNNPDAYIFGFEDGTQAKGFKRMWHELFTAAGLKWGRDNGLVWHTTRAEYISRLAEDRGPAVAQWLARHKKAETTEGYVRQRNTAMWEAAASLNR